MRTLRAVWARGIGLSAALMALGSVAGCLEDGVEDALANGRVFCSYASSNGVFATCPQGYSCQQLGDQTTVRERFGADRVLDCEMYGCGYCAPVDDSIWSEACDSACGPGEETECSGETTACVCGGSRAVAGPACVGGTCTDGTCSCTSPRVSCPDGACHDLNTEASNCGACGQGCGAGQVCTGGECGCPAGQADCGGSCVDVRGDRQNCGACGRSCELGNACVAGQCALDLDWSALSTIAGAIPMALATDGTSLFVSYMNFEEPDLLAEIWRLPFDGSAPNQVLKESSSITAIAAHQDRLYYWASQVQFSGGTYSTTRILRAVDGDGTDAQELERGTPIGERWPNWVKGVQVVPPNLYYFDRRPPQDDGDYTRLWVVPLDGSQAVSKVLGYFNTMEAFRVDGDEVFFLLTTPTHAIQRAALSSPSVWEMVTPWPGDFGNQLRASPSSVYWVDEQSLWQVPRAGGNPQDLFDTSNDAYQNGYYWGFSGEPGFLVDAAADRDVVYMVRGACREVCGTDACDQVGDDCHPTMNEYDHPVPQFVLARYDTQSQQHEFLDLRDVAPPAGCNDAAYGQWTGVLCNGAQGLRLLSDLGDTVLVVTSGRLWFMAKDSDWSAFSPP